jgi:MFS family permease
MFRSQPVTITALGLAQILAWGTSFYFPAVFAGPIVAETGWSLFWVVSGTSLGLLVAGLISPRVGTLIDRHGGRPILASSSVLFSLGLIGLALAPNLPVYLLAWTVIGCGMGAGLYDAVFAALGKLYGREARAPITNLTLFGGFASTVCWPLSAFLIETFGWRHACVVYALAHLVIALPLQLAVMPAQARLPDPVSASEAQQTEQVRPVQNFRLVFSLIAMVLTIASGIGSIVIVHMMTFLQARGADFATAVALGTLFGPAQVAARVIERLFGTHYHPIWTMIASCTLMSAGVAALWGGFAVLPLAILVYGAGYGIMWVARGTLPLALFGPARYATLIGRLAFPALIVQALAPSVGASLIEAVGPSLTMAVLVGFAALNVLLVAALWATCRRSSSS